MKILVTIFVCYINQLSSVLFWENYQSRLSSWRIFTFELLANENYQNSIKMLVFDFYLCQYTITALQ